MKSSLKVLEVVLAVLLAVSLTACGGGGDGDSNGNGGTGTIYGSVSGTTVIAVNNSGDIIASDDTTGKTPDANGNYPFTLNGIPLNINIRLYLVTGGAVYPMYFDSGTGTSNTNIFSLTSATDINLGFVDTSTAVAVPTNNPLSQGATDAGENSAIPPMVSLTGTWEVNSLSSGPGAPWWMRGPITINSDGSFSGTLDEYESAPDTVSGTLSISSDGIITLTDDNGSDMRGSLDSGKSVIAMTQTWTTGSPGTTEMSILTKKGESYSLADLVGTWEVNSLSSGPGAPWWMRGPITINSDGSFSGTLDEYESAPDTVSGTLSISSDGIITLTDDDGSDMRGSLDSGKSVIAMTQTWTTGSPGTTEMSVLTKKGE